MCQPTRRSCCAVSAIPRGCPTFFRLSPAADGKPPCFAVRRGEIKERIDPKFILYGGHQKITGVPTATLGSLAIREPDYGSSVRAVPMESPDDVKYIRITDFDDDGIVPGHEFVTAQVIEDDARLQHDDVLFARSGATAGKTYIHDKAIGPAVFAGYCIRFQFDRKRVMPKFVYYYTKTTRYQAWVRSIQRPAGQPNINKEEFKSFTIPVPEMRLQERLVAELESARAGRQRKLAEAEGLLAGLDEYLLAQLGLTPPPPDNRKVFAVRLTTVQGTDRLNADYFHPERILAIRAMEANRAKMRVERLADIGDFIRDAVPADSSVNYLGLANVQSNTGELVESGEDPAEGLCFKFRAGDVLFARLRPYLNKVHRAERDGICSTEFHVIRIRPSAKPDDEIRPDYLATVLRSSLVLAQTRHMMTGNTHPRLANEDVVNLVVPIPKAAIQERIAGEVARRRTEARRLRTEAATGWAAAKAHFEQQLLASGDR
jgi:hypothetical protein